MAEILWLCALQHMSNLEMFPGQPKWRSGSNCCHSIERYNKLLLVSNFHLKFSFLWSLVVCNDLYCISWVVIFLISAQSDRFPVSDNGTTPGMFSQNLSAFSSISDIYKPHFSKMMWLMLNLAYSWRSIRTFFYFCVNYCLNYQAVMLIFKWFQGIHAFM